MRAAHAILLMLLCATAFAQEHKVGVLKFEPLSLSPIARQANVTGEVKMNVSIGGDGNVQNVDVLSGHPMLRETARKTVSMWRFVCLDCKFGESFKQQITFAYFVEGEPNCNPAPPTRFEYKFPAYAALFRGHISICDPEGMVLRKNWLSHLFRRR
jgi:TonB family protein